MGINPPLGSGIPPDLSQKRSVNIANKPQFVSSKNSKRPTIDLQRGEGFSTATRRLESPKLTQISSGPNRQIQRSGVLYPIQTQPPNKNLEH